MLDLLLNKSSAILFSLKPRKNREMPSNFITLEIDWGLEWNSSKNLQRFQGLLCDSGNILQNTARRELNEIS
jgi:hypothetical protein